MGAVASSPCSRPPRQQGYLPRCRLSRLPRTLPHFSPTMQAKNSRIFEEIIKICNKTQRFSTISCMYFSNTSELAFLGYYRFLKFFEPFLPLKGTTVWRASTFLTCPHFLTMADESGACARSEKLCDNQLSIQGLTERGKSGRSCTRYLRQLLSKFS